MFLRLGNAADALIREYAQPLGGNERGCLVSRGVEGSALTQ